MPILIYSIMKNLTHLLGISKSWEKHVMYVNKNYKKWSLINQRNERVVVKVSGIREYKTRKGYLYQQANCKNNL